ncbi:DNA polymerase III subunit beta [Corynebacterium uterequi]|uniref:Beta sliding clamp n=1 Tax=Corynebacterium uterequi TaxID=1072256 RepID=A0A0G3HBG2_9CORY|nr:DNA polymerase III subunit beta [Corynebacterium uterequi]AKK10035.1 DNA polymerase III, beta subunit [Corynebacterium uterequi]
MESQSVSFRVAYEEFESAVAWVARSLPSKAAQPVLRAMVITADAAGLELAGFDYEISTRTRVPAEVDDEGCFAVAGRLIADIVKNLPKKPVELKVKGSKALLKCGSAHFELPTIPLDDYPKLPDMPEVTGTVTPSLLAEAIDQVSAAAGRDDTLPMLTGINMKIDGEKIRLAATDRFRLAVRTLEWEPSSPGVSADLLIPAKSLQENAGALNPSSPDPVKISVGTGESIGAEGLFGLQMDDRQTTTRMLDADFPNITPLIPKSHTAIATVDIAELQDVIRRVSLVTDRNAQIRMEFSEKELVVSAGGTDSAHAEESIPAAFVGRDTFLTAFNPSYLKDGLKALRSDRVVFGFTEPSRPAILIPEPEEMPTAGADGSFPSPETHFTYLLMPVRLPG